MKKYALIFAVIFGFLFLAPGAVFAQRGGAASETIEIRIASMLPRNSDWGRSLDRIAAEWARVTNNTLRTRVIHDGLEGSEARMLSSLNTNHLQAALFSSLGLAHIVPEVMNLSVPFMIGNEAELDLVLREILPLLEQKASSSTNFVIITWSRGGWVNIFSREQVLAPDDLRRMRVASSSETENMNTVFRGMGFTLVDGEPNDMAPMLASGAISALYTAPAAIAPFGLHRTVGHMLDMPIAPFMGGLVMNRVTWDRLGPERQRAIIDVTRRIALEFDAAMPRTTANAISAMQRDGLRVNRPTPAQQALWRGEVERAMPPLLGNTFDRDMHNRINAILERARSGQ
ncbi:MAG: TRAP transporter substrate-binding protein DctP [Treponema sp.]|nr:TRAP transporter substrate-binding protein DctP [Treponema sp.]